MVGGPQQPLVLLGVKRKMKGGKRWRIYSHRRKETCKKKERRRSVMSITWCEKGSERSGVCEEGMSERPHVRCWGLEVWIERWGEDGAWRSCIVCMWVRSVTVSFPTSCFSYQFPLLYIFLIIILQITTSIFPCKIWGVSSCTPTFFLPAPYIFFKIFKLNLIVLDNSEIRCVL